MIRRRETIWVFLIVFLLVIPAAVVISFVLNRNSQPISIDINTWDRPLETISGKDRYFLTPDQLADRIKLAKENGDPEAAYEVWAYFKAFKETADTRSKIDSWAVYAADLGNSEAALYLELEGIDKSQVNRSQSGLAGEIPAAPEEG